MSIAMELRDDRLTAFFNVIFGGDHVAIDLNAIHFRTERAARATISGCLRRR